jgi:DNA-binding NarL/FixJ family response regulator
VPALTTTRVVLVDDEQLIRAGLRLLLHGRDGIEVVGEASNGVEASAVVEATPCDVVLMDIRMPRRDGISATADIRALPDAPPVLVLTTFDDDDLVVEALNAGAIGFLLKDTPPDELALAVRAAAAGRQTFAPRVLDGLVQAALARRAPTADAEEDRLLATLTERERDVADAVAQGLSNAQISTELSMSLATVKTHLGRVFDKLQAENRVQVALRVRQLPRR